jgi:micrococcal nuclease
MIHKHKKMFHCYRKADLPLKEPERGQPFGKKAKQFTAAMVFRKQVKIEPVDRDRYGRTVAWVYVDGRNLCEELVRAGLAWHYKKYSSDRNLADLEIRARKGRVGLWSDPRAIAPWDYRRLKRSRE